MKSVGGWNSDGRGDVVEIDSWVAAEGKNGMRRDFLVRDYTTGEVIARATRCVTTGIFSFYSLSRQSFRSFEIH